MTVTDGRAVLVLENFPSPVMARALSPNGRAHWATKRKFTEAVHDFVKLRAFVQQLQPMIGYVVMQPTFIYPVARTRDDDNLSTGVLKAVRDGLVRAGLLMADDMDHLEQKRPIVEVQKRRRALILEFHMAERKA